MVKEDYLFIDGFSRYYWVWISEDDDKKIKLTKKWGSYAYNIMPFGLKNDPTIFSKIVIASSCDFIQRFLEVYMDD